MKTKTMHNSTMSDLQQIEFFRQGLALLPEPSDKRPGVAFYVPGDDFHLAQRFCTCALSQNRTCSHLKSLLKTFKMVHQTSLPSFEDRFRSSVWYHLATVLGETRQASQRTLVYRSQNSENHQVLNVKGSGGETLVHYYSPGTDRVRFLERSASSDSRDAVPHRGWALTQLSRITRTDNEKAMNARGFKTRKQDLEASFWYRCAYHCFREFEETGPNGGGCTFKPAISEKTGAFTVICLSRNGDPLIRLFIPRDKVRKLLSAFQQFSPGEHALGIHPIPLKSIFRITQNTELDLEIRPQIRLIQENGEERFFENEDLKKFTYGSLVYLKEMGIMAQLETPGRPRKFKAPVKMVLKKSQLPVFLEEYEDDLADGPFLVDASVTGFRILKAFDRIQIRPEALDRDWYWLSVAYGFGNAEISLAEILKTRKAGQRFIKTDEGWIDCASETFGDLEDVARDIRMEDPSAEGEHMGISPMALFRLQAQSPQPLDIRGGEEAVHRLRQTLAFKPAKPFSSPAGLYSTLRRYQASGTEWIHFLYQNRFGGLLCDDMGLGKTHEVMAFMVGLLEQSSDLKPFLVVCPTTVLSHWKNVVRRYAPSLDPVTYHGKERDLEEALAGHPLILTSYGILRRDIEALASFNFSVSVFDEIQNLKNTQTQIYQAAGRIQARMKLGLTGTPIENRLEELKALLDLTLPGYLGKDADFEHRYVKPIENREDEDRRVQLSNLVAPFTLRRKKESVLHDLPEKIEDIRTCTLSEDQVKLYRDAVSAKGTQLLKNLQQKETAIPYIHIFALLNLLKQICNHPALVQNRIENFEEFQSGKWDLFKELLQESLESGQKVVIYSQFLDMIQIMERYLTHEAIDFVSLTGKTTNREKVIGRFNDDPDCRVFVGSLKAGGLGIDLVAASVVIHYDRWWNAAKEDQATDRVHRIGQKRGVQVFKLVTEGTLEEKIAAIIEKKRNLMDSVIEETDPSLMKGFTREELMELLAIPRIESSAEFSSQRD